MAKAVVGLEVHAQLASKHKLFSHALVDCDAAPNTHVAPFDAAHPGSMPVLNMQCVLLALRAVLLFNCQNIERNGWWDRKHYRYGDLPAGYQITQHSTPLGRDGSLVFRNRQLGISQIHMEQDTAKKIGTSFDLNRAGVGLIEIVTQPDLENGEQAEQAVRELQLLLRDAGICEGQMAKGQLRVDANVSIGYGARAEIKNVSGLTTLRLAIDAEINRQRTILGNGGILPKRETRSYDEVNDVTLAMRIKEDLADYGFIREGDLPLLSLGEDLIEQARKDLGNRLNRREKRKRYSELGLNETETDALLEYPFADHFESMTRTGARNRARAAYNLLMNTLLGIISRNDRPYDLNSLDSNEMNRLLDGLLDGHLDSKIFFL